MFKNVAAGMVILALIAWAMPQSASAVSVLPAGLYLLQDHPDAQLWDHSSTSGPNGPYGLRMDSMPGTPGPTFSMEQGGAEVFMYWDGGATASIYGEIQHNVDGDLWDLTFTITGITAAAPGIGGGFVSTGGTGMISDQNSADEVALAGKQDGGGHAFRFLGDGHRMPDNDTAVGRGWIDASGTNDFLFTATPVPEPGSLGLLGLGLVAGLRRLRKR